MLLQESHVREGFLMFAWFSSDFYKAFHLHKLLKLSFGLLTQMQNISIYFIRKDFTFYLLELNKLIWDDHLLWFILNISNSITLQIGHALDLLNTLIL